MIVSRITGTARRFPRLTALTILGGLIIGFVLGILGYVPTPSVSLNWHLPAAVASEYQPARSVASGDELALVYIGSSNCGWSNVTELPPMVKHLKLLLKDRAAGLGISFAAIGVARDMHAVSGVRHLAKFGEFDEVMSGRGWSNIGLQKYVYGDDLAGPAATPQVIVLERSLADRGGHLSLEHERVLVRKTGLDDITAWFQNGALTPSLGLPNDR